MDKYGVTNEGFVIKRMDKILEEVHADLTEGFGFDTRLNPQSFIGVLVTTFGSQIADLWEVAQESYYAKYPTTATGINLDNAVQYSGIRRKGNKRTLYSLHCTGDDGTTVREGAVVASNTLPQKKLTATGEFTISRSNFNRARIRVAAVQKGAVYTVTINSTVYSYSNLDGEAIDIINGLAGAIKDDRYTVAVDSETPALVIEDKTAARSNTMSLSDNLTTQSITVIANFETEEYGKVSLPNGTVDTIITNISGFDSVVNLLEPTWGRYKENDIELRHSYLAKSGLRSSRMISSIISALKEEVDGVETATGYENDEDVTDENGLPPHSIQIVVEGGDEMDIARVILERKAGGIQTYGEIEVGTHGIYGDTIPIHFDRPEYLYVWLKVVLYGNVSLIPTNYKELTTNSILADTKNMQAGETLISQLLNEGIYDTVGGITRINIMAAYSSDKSYTPGDEDYTEYNVYATTRQKVLTDENRIGVEFDGDKSKLAQRCASAVSG